MAEGGKAEQGGVGVLFLGGCGDVFELGGMGLVMLGLSFDELHGLELHRHTRAAAKAELPDALDLFVQVGSSFTPTSVCLASYGW